MVDYDNDDLICIINIDDGDDGTGNKNNNNNSNRYNNNKNNENGSDNDVIIQWSVNVSHYSKMYTKLKYNDNSFVWNKCS